MKFRHILLGLLFGISAGIITLSSSSFGANMKRDQENPVKFLDSFASELNIENSGIQENTFNDFDPRQGQYASQYRISNTLDTMRIKIAPYIQRTMYIGLSLAVIGIIYNGLMLVLHPAGVGEGESSKVKTRIGKILKGAFILIGFYAIVQGVLALIGYLLQ